MKKSSLVLAVCLFVSVAGWSRAEGAPVETPRLGGLDRFETAALVAAEVSSRGLSGSTVILASGLNYPDALVGGGWADPSVILLTRRDELPSSTIGVIEQPSIKTVLIVGGTAVVSSVVENQIRSMGKSVERLSGPTRYETSLEVFKAVTKQQKASSLWLASGTSFADQLVAVSAARRVGGVVAIVPPWKPLDSSVVDVLRGGLAVGAEVHIVDGARALESISLSGFTIRQHVDDPFANSVALQAGNNEQTYVASGANWPDALAASRLVTSSDRLVLSRSNCSPKSVLGEIASTLDSGKATLIGGPVAIGTADTLRSQCPNGEPPVSISRDECRIPQGPLPPNSVDSRHSTGFPLNEENLPTQGVMRVLVIPVDWSNYPGSQENLIRELDQIRVFMDVYGKMSEGRISFETLWSDKWNRLPERVESYPQEWTSDFNTKLAQHAVDAVDEAVDFAKVDLVILVFPDDPPIPVTRMDDAGFGATQNFNDYFSPGSNGPIDPRAVFSDEGFVRNYVGGGQYFDHPLRPVWTYYVHEVGHVINLPDWYLREANYGPEFEVQDEYATGPMSHWDAMSSQDGPSRTFSSWTRWLLGWLGDERVLCLDSQVIQDSGSFEFELLPLDVYGTGTKTIMVRTGQYEGFVIESRRAVFPDHDLVWWNQVGRDPYGLIVYRVDTTKGNSRGTLSIVPPAGQGVAIVNVSDRFDPRLIDGLYNLGASGEVDGVRVELVRTGAKDTVRLTALPS